MSVAGKEDSDLPNIVHDKKRHEFRLTLPNQQHKNKVGQERT